MRNVLSAVLLLAPALALAGERTVVLQSFEDGSHPAELDVCRAHYGEALNVVLGATAWSLQTRAYDGEVMNQAIRKIGDITGCGAAPSLAQVPPPPYTPEQHFLMKFDLADGTYVFKGQCDVVSVTVPVPRILLVGCALRLVEMPEGVIGGFATSASVFNPYGVSGFGTGSIWTLHVYTQD